MYKAKHLSSGYLKKLPSVCSSLKKKMELSSDLIVNTTTKDEVLLNLNPLEMAQLVDPV